MALKCNSMEEGEAIENFAREALGDAAPSSPEEGEDVSSSEN